MRTFIDSCSLKINKIRLECWIVNAIDLPCRIIHPCMSYVHISTNWKTVKGIITCYTAASTTTTQKKGRRKLLWSNQHKHTN